MCLQLLLATKLCFLCVDSGSANLQPIDTNRPFYSCLFSDLAFAWQRGWS